MNDIIFTGMMEWTTLWNADSMVLPCTVWVPRTQSLLCLHYKPWERRWGFQQTAGRNHSRSSHL